MTKLDEKDPEIQSSIESLYQKETRNNNNQFMEMLKAVRPDIFVLIDMVDDRGFDPYIMLKIIRQISNIAIGSGYGQVVISIEKGVVRFVRGEDVDKIELPVFKKRDKLDI